MYFHAPSSMERGFMSFCLALVVLNLVVFLMDRERKHVRDLKKIYLRHSIVLLLCFVVVFFQYYTDYILGLIDETLSFVWVDTAIVCKSMALSTIALSSILTGYKFRKIKEPSVNKYIFQHYSFRIPKEYLCYLGYFMLVAYVLFVPRSYRIGGYGNHAEGGVGVIFLVLIQAILVAVFAIYCYQIKIKGARFSIYRELKHPLILSSLYLIAVLLTGRRVEAVRIGLLLLFAYSYLRGTKANIKLVLTVCVFFAVFFSAMKFLRVGDVSSLGKSVDAVTESTTISPFTQELAGSVNTVHIAVSYFPDVVPYNYGLTFFPNFALLVPGLSRVREAYSEAYGISFKSGDVLTALQLGDNSSWQLGSSMVADVYISFGMIGVLIVFFLFGVFLRYLDVGTFADFRTPYFLVLSFGCGSLLMYACRGTIANLFLSWSYATILVLLTLKKER